MARDKKPNKANKKKYADPKTGAFRHSDGDRRHHGAMASAKDAIKQKKKFQQTVLPPEEPDPTDEWDESEIWDGDEEAGGANP